MILSSVSLLLQAAYSGTTAGNDVAAAAPVASDAAVAAADVDDINDHDNDNYDPKTTVFSGSGCTIWINLAVLFRFHVMKLRDEKLLSPLIPRGKE